MGAINPSQSLLENVSFPNPLLSCFVNICFTIGNHCSNRINYFLRSVSATLPSGQLSNVPWRRTGVKYNNNEAYFDVIEEIDAIIDKSGSVVSAEIQGYVSIECF